MRVAVTAQGPDLNNLLDRHFGRARCFLIVDTETGQCAVWGNGDLAATAHMAGIQAAGALLGLGVEAVITGNIGPKAFETFRSAGVPVYASAARTVRQAVEAIRASSLSPLAHANVREHRPQEAGGVHVGGLHGV